MVNNPNPFHLANINQNGVDLLKLGRIKKLENADKEINHVISSLLNFG